MTKIAAIVILTVLYKLALPLNEGRKEPVLRHKAQVPYRVGNWQILYCLVLVHVLILFVLGVHLQLLKLWLIRVEVASRQNAPVAALGRVTPMPILLSLLAIFALARRGTTILAPLRVMTDPSRSVPGQAELTLLLPEILVFGRSRLRIHHTQRLC